MGEGWGRPVRASADEGAAERRGGSGGSEGGDEEGEVDGAGAWPHGLAFCFTATAWAIGLTRAL